MEAMFGDPLFLKEERTMFKRILVQSVCTVAGFMASVALSLAASPAEKSRESKLDLTPRSFARIHTLIRPQENEWRHLNVKWLTDVVAARKRAAAEDKPMVVIYTGGAGYNEPLGVC
jgi:hypothetical protein